jgi:hypothetical protein
MGDAVNQVSNNRNIDKEHQNSNCIGLPRKES